MTPNKNQLNQLVPYCITYLWVR